MRGIDLDAPETTALRRDLVMRDPAKRFAFEIWYRMLAQVVQDVPEGKKVELGSGGGFLDEFIPGLIRTDVVDLPFLDGVCFAEDMPYEDGELSAILMVNVLHHIPDSRAFFREACRALKPGGRIAMIEPTVTPLSRLVYRHLHHEPFDPGAKQWELPPAGRLSGGNDALPWIIFYRDLQIFKKEFPELKLVQRKQFDFAVHILSEGVTTRAFLPKIALKTLWSIETILRPVLTPFVLFQLVVVEKC